MGDSSRVGEARRHAARLAAALGFGDVEAGRVALVVTELGTNLCKHAKAGVLLVGSRSFGEGRTEIEVLSLDKGPGIANIEQCMGDGFSTGGSPGTGLGAIRRLADDFDIHTQVPSGTVCVARVRGFARAEAPASAFRVGVVALTAPGETVTGDGWILAAEGTRAALLVADGLGHGPAACEAAQAAVRIFAKAPFGPLAPMLEQSHATLRATRGAAVYAALADAQAGTIRSAGAGNVIMRVFSGVSDRTLLSQHGTVGVQMRRIEETDAEWPRHAVLAVHTDGIMTRWPASAVAGLLGRDPGLVAGVIARDFCRGRDDATILVLRRKE